MKKALKILSVVLTVALLMGIFSCATPVFAAEVTEITENTTDTTKTDETVAEENAEEETEVNEPEPLNEIVEWRTENIKYFRNSDGSYTAAQYAYPVHYKENGEWKEIDNSLTENTVNESIFNSKKEFVAENTNTPVSFPEKFNEDGSNEISVTVENYKISFSPDKIKNRLTDTNGKIKDREDLKSVEIAETANEKQKLSTLNYTNEVEKTEKQNHKKEDKFKVENKSGAVAYEDVFDKVDLEYELNNSKLKESIILNKKQKDYTFSFNMDLGGLYPVPCENGSINLCSNKAGETPVAKIEAPYMLDSNGEYSDAVTMTIAENGEEYTLTVTANEAWLNADERAYPVVIDPTIRLDINAAHTYDCYVDDSLPNEALPYDVWLYVGNNSLGKTQAFVKFDLPDLPGDNYLITNASIVYYQYEIDPGNGSNEYMTIHKLNEYWNNEDYNVTWNNKPDFDEEAVLDYAKFYGANDDNLYPYEFDVTRTVKEWYEGEANYGFALKLKDETATKRARLVSAEHPVDNYYPSVYVTFRDNKGIESYWSYSSYSIGSAGNAYINDYTGNLVYELPILSSISERAPLTLTAYYNNYCANESLTAGKNGSSRTTIGKGFRLNVQQTVLPSTDYGLSGDSAEKYPYVYTDADGTEHYIQKVTEDEETVYKDEDGLGLTLKTKDDITGTDIDATYQITDKAHNNYYFNSEGNLRIIEDKNGNRITITFVSADDNDNFRSKTRISKITDGAGHTFTFSYYDTESGNLVKSITDNFGRTVSFDISKSLLKNVSYYNGDSVDIAYETHTEIINDETKEVNIIDYVQSNKSYRLCFNYTEAEQGRRVRTVTEYGLESDGETITKETKGQVVSFNRSKYNTTIIRSCGMDGIHNGTNEAYGDDDIITTIQFDNMGRAISQQMKFGSGKEIGAGSVAYTSGTDDETASGFKNKVSGSGASGKYVENLLYGGNAEDNTYWSFGTAGSVSAEESISSASKYIGENSIKLTINEITKEDGRCFYKQDLSNVAENTDYTLSAYVKTGDLEAFSDDSLTGAFIQLKGFDSEGNEITAVNTRSQILTERSDLDVNNGWRRLTCTVTTSSDIAFLRCYLFLRNTKGPVCFDGIQLEKGSTANDYNMLENSNFSYASSGVPTSWSGTSQFVFETNKNGVIKPADLPDDSYYNDITTKTVRMTGSPDVEKGIYQSVDVEGNPDDTYILSGWAKGIPVNSTFHTEMTAGKDTETTEDDEYKETALFEIAVKVKYSASDGTNPEQYKTSAVFNTTITDWQCASVPISLKYTDAKEDITYTPQRITIILRYHNQENFVFFDKIMLVKDVASSYTYDSEGNLISASSNSEQKSQMEYDNNNLTSYKDAAGFTTELNYTENNLNIVTSPKEVFTDYDYNDYGNATNSELRNKKYSDEATASIRTTADYSYSKELDNVTINAGSYQTRSHDANGNTTHYYSDYATGTPTKVINAENTETVYEYYSTTSDTDFGKQKSVTTNGSKVTYEYNGKQQLSKIIFGNILKEEYSFEYDNFGNVAKTLVGSQPLSTNTYAGNNGVLQATTYGNGDSRRYSYNNFGQKIVDYVTDGGTEEKLYSWAYDDSGVNVRHTDYENNLQYIFDYDSLGRLSKEEVKNYNTGAFAGYTEYGYDVRNNLTELITKYGNKASNQKYFYSAISGIESTGNYEKDNLPTKYQLYSNRYALYDYDGINRLNQREFKLENKSLFYNYVYKLSDRNAEGSKVYKTTQIQDEYIGDDVYIYTYNDLGNITSIQKAERSDKATNTTGHNTPVDYATYSYDALGQLTKEINAVNDTKTVWTYDELGNITARNEYVNSTGALSKTVTYGYGKDGKTGWNNLLISVDLDGDGVGSNDTIAYDAIGNPTTYLGAALTWNGRQLTSYKTAEKEIAYTYDANGLRATKTVNGVTSEYYYVNGNLHYEERSDGTKLYFFYDSNGYLSGIEYNGTNYYPATNRRGDVVAIYNYLGECIVRYEYDAWGKSLSVKDGNGVEITDQSHIAHVNPIRYRGYYYDTETELYYLQSRYYNPEVGRFLNGDSISDSGAGVLGFNTFIYCANNPVNASDPSGHSIIGAILLGAAIGAVVNGAINLASQLKRNNGDWKAVNKKELGIATAIGGVSGALSGAFGFGVGELAKTAVTKTVATIIGEGLINTTVGNIQAMATGEERTLTDNVRDFTVGAMVTGIGTAIPVFSNNSVFNNATKSEKRSLLNNAFTNREIRNGVTNTDVYGDFLLYGSDELTECFGFAVTLFEEYTNE